MDDQNRLAIPPRPFITQRRGAALAPPGVAAGVALATSEAMAFMMKLRTPILDADGAAREAEEVGQPLAVDELEERQIRICRPESHSVGE